MKKKQPPHRATHLLFKASYFYYFSLSSLLQASFLNYLCSVTSLGF